MLKIDNILNKTKEYSFKYSRIIKTYIKYINYYFSNKKNNLKLN